MEHRCPKCNEDLHIARSKFETDVGSTDIYSCLDMVCVNPKCDNYCGADLGNPKTVVEVVKNKVN